MAPSFSLIPCVRSLFKSLESLAKAATFCHKRLAFMAVCVLLAEPRTQKAVFHGLASEFVNEFKIQSHNHMSLAFLADIQM